MPVRLDDDADGPRALTSVREGASQLYVSRGTGFWGPPMRLGAPAEITELMLRSP